MQPQNKTAMGWWCSDTSGCVTRWKFSNGGDVFTAGKATDCAYWWVDDSATQAQALKHRARPRCCEAVKESSREDMRPKGAAAAQVQPNNRPPAIHDRRKRAD